MSRVANRSAGIVVAAVVIAVSPAQAQVPCIDGANPGPCSNPAGVTLVGISTSSDNSGVTNSGSVVGTIQTIGINSDVTNFGSVGNFISVIGSDSSVTNSGSVTIIQTNGENSGVTNSGLVHLRIGTRGNNSTVTNSGSVGDYIQTDGDNSGVTNSGLVSKYILTTADGSGVTNSGSVGSIIETQGDNSAVTNSASVGNAIVTSGINSGVTNSGAVHFGILTSGDSSAVINQGSITNDILTNGDNSGVTNSGFVGGIIATGDIDSAVSNSGTVIGPILTFEKNSGVTNSGSVGSGITTEGDNSGTSNSGIVFGRIETKGEHATVTNAGLVENDIVTSGASSGVTNSGSVEGNIFTSGVNSAVTNSGSVERIIGTLGANSGVTNSGSVGWRIVTQGSSSSVTNSGSIGLELQGTGGIILEGDDSSLTLLPGSVVWGALSISNPGTATLNIPQGFNALLTFDALPNTINIGAPFAISGTQLAVLDTTAFAQQDELLADLTGGIFNSIHARLAGGGTASFNSVSAMQVGMSPMMLGGAMMNLGAAESATEAPQAKPGVWADVFGGLRNDDATATTFASDTQYFGGVAGIDGRLMPGVLVGAFGGAARSTLDVALNGEAIEADSFFGGGYASFRGNRSFAHVMITAGTSDYDSNRRIANNLVAGGLETASASYDGAFISPEVTIGTTLEVGGFTIEPSARGRYAFLSLDGYTETGSAANLTVGDQDVSLWLGRMQIAFPFATEQVTFAPRVGVEAWTSDNDNVSAVLLGQAIAFAPGGDDSQVTGFIGATATTRLSASASAFLDGEVHAGDDGLTRSEARAGVKVNF